MNPVVKFGVRAFAVVAGFWAVGLAVFVQSIPAPSALPAAHEYDGIIVLTGDRGRIDSGLQALTAGSGKRLLISGVNAALDSKTILTAIGSSPELAACCIDLGRAALDTRGNATEAADWVRDHKFRSLLVITSDYHMMRTMVEFERALSDVSVTSMPVATDPGIILIALEYSKYLISLARFDSANP